MEIDAQNAHQQQGRSAHQHQRQLHGRVFLASRTPYADEQVHRNQRNLVEQEHREQVDRDKKAEYADRQQREPREILARHHSHLPRSQHPGKDDDRREQQHGHRYAVDTDRIVYVQRSVPNRVGRIEHLGRIARRPLAQKQDGQRNGQSQQHRGPRHHHRPHGPRVRRAEHRAGHQHRNQYKQR